MLARRLMLCLAVILSLGGRGVVRDALAADAMGNDVCLIGFGAGGQMTVTLKPAQGESVQVALVPGFLGARRCEATVDKHGGKATIALRSGRESASVAVEMVADGCVVRVERATGEWRGFAGTVTGNRPPLYAARIALDDARQPQVYGSGDILDIAAGTASNRRMNAVYSIATFRGALLDAGDGTPDLRPAQSGYSLRLRSGQLALRVLDAWQLIGWRPPLPCGFGHPDEGKPRVIPRAWIESHRPFPWKELSPVQLPFISITDPADYGRVKEQVDFLAANLRDWGFFCFGEWPLTQHNPEYDPERRKAYLEGNKRTCDYAHSKGIKILRWLTDPDIEPSYYPEMYADFKRRGWFENMEPQGEWLLDYTNPEVQQWVEKQYTDLGATGPDFYWVDNNRPTKPRHDPTRFPPDAFREFFLAIQRGLLSTGRNDILMRSGASACADYSGAGILDVYAPGPDVQNDWTEQQLYVAGELARNDYLCHFNLWRRSIDDYFPAGPQTVDQTRAMATLLGLTGLSFTTTDIGFPKMPAERLRDLRRVVPVAAARPMDLYRFGGALPRWWVLNQQHGGHAFQVAGVFNWGLKIEETDFASLDDLGLDPGREYLAFDFWSQKPVGRFRGAVGLRVAPASGRAIALHPAEAEPFIVGTDRHVAMGAADLADVRWDAKSKTLAASFVAGVAGETFRLTFYSPMSLRPVTALAGAAAQPVEEIGDGLFAMPIPCQAATVPIKISFAPYQFAAKPGPAKAAGDVIDLSSAAVLADLAKEGGTDRLLARARAGEGVVMVSPAAWSEELQSLQKTLDLRWGLFREPRPDATWLLTVGDQGGEVGDDVMFRSTCIAFQPSTAQAYIRPMGKGLIAVVRPYDGTGGWGDLVGRLKKPVADVLAGAKSARDETLRKATSTVGPFEVNAAKTEGTAPLRVSPALAHVSLSFHFRRLSFSLITNDWAVPPVSLLVNGQELPHKLNPCRPESPPQEWDSLYFKIPDGVLRFDGKDTVTVRSQRPAAKAEALRDDLQAGLELCIDDAAVAGRTTLAPLAEAAEVASMALTPQTSLDALLGLDGWLRYLSHVGSVDLKIIGGTAHNGWGAKSGGVSHCIFANQEFTIVVRVPKESSGILEAWAYDYEAYRREEVTFEGGAPQMVENFGAGKWLSFPFGPKESGDSELRLTVRSVLGNAVLSRLRLRFEGEGG
jgi:hypothetical protein